MDAKHIYKNASVAVVGNADGYEPFEAHSKRDIVVTCNRSPLECSAHVIYWDPKEQWDETKTLSDAELEFCTLPLLINIYAMRDDSRKMGEFCKRYNIAHSYYVPQPLEQPPMQNNIFKYERLAVKLNGRPLTGFLAIQDALDNGAREVYVTQFTFYYDAESQVVPSRAGPHDIFAHLDYMSELLQTEPRFNPDVTLRKLLHWWDTIAHPLEKKHG